MSPKTRFAVAFLAPAVLLYSAFVFLPILMSFGYSLTNWRLGREVEFVGFRNYVELWGDRQYWQVAWNSFSLVAGAVLVQVPFAFALAYMLHWIGRGFRLFRSVLFLPVVIASIAVGFAFTIFLNGDVGAFNAILRSVGLEGWTRNWLSDSEVVLWAVNVPSLWHGVGLFVIIFVAAMRGLPQEIFEAAAVDGAGRLRTLFSIVVPLLRDVIMICLILAATGAMRAFDHSWIMTKGGPGHASSYFGTLIYKRGFLDGQIADASAMAVTLFAYVMLLVVAFRLMLRGARA